MGICGQRGCRVRRQRPERKRFSRRGIDLSGKMGNYTAVLADNGATRMKKIVNGVEYEMRKRRNSSPRGLSWSGK